MPADAVRSKTYCTGDPTPAANGKSMTRRSYTRCTLTIGDVAEVRRLRASARGQRPGGQQRGDAVVGHGDDDGVGVEPLAVDHHGLDDARTAVAAIRLDAVDARAGAVPGRRAPRARARGGLGVQLRQRHPRPSDVGGGRVGQEAGLEDHRGERERGLVGVDVERRERDQVPQPSRSRRATARRRQPLAEGDRVERGIGWVEPLERERGAAQPDPVPHREMRVPEERPAEVQRRRERVAAEVRDPATRRDHGDVEPVLQHDPIGRPDPVEEAAVGRAATQEHVLTVVEVQTVVVEGPRGAAEPRPALEQRHLGAAVGAGERGGEPGEPTADDDDPSRASGPAFPAAHGWAPARLRAATTAFSQVGSDIRRSRTAVGSASIRTSRRR